MARGIIGGIVLSTLVTLVLVPVFYVLIERLRGGRGLLLAAPRDDGQAATSPLQLMETKTGIPVITKEETA
jgi:hypothetical protein